MNEQEILRFLVSTFDDYRYERQTSMNMSEIRVEDYMNHLRKKIVYEKEKQEEER